VLKHDRSLLLRTSAKSAAEALLRVYSQASDREQFLQSLHNVTCQRLVRRLCDECKVEVQVQPKAIQQLGGDPNRQNTIFNQWKLPPPEQQVDEKGRPIEFPPCEACGGIGYIGRIAVFEMITLNDPLRQIVKKNPKIAPLEEAAVKLGKKTLAQQAYQLVLLGVTSLAEAQRVLKEQP
jgi:type II secretory ATPase GspE/PulE/Tfp pilus assembly ATPase PilB-like protein